MPSDDEQRLDRQRQVLQRVADKLVERRLEAPAILVLESVKPLSFIASQGLVFLGPLLQPLLSVRDYDTFAEALESRENLEWLISRLEAGEEGRGTRDAGGE
jgi:hypothetical protein